jgi:hypothetical protein
LERPFGARNNNLAVEQCIMVRVAGKAERTTVHGAAVVESLKVIPGSSVFALSDIACIRNVLGEGVPYYEFQIDKGWTGRGEMKVPRRLLQSERDRVSGSVPTD